MGYPEARFVPFKHRILLLALIRKSYLIILALVWGWGGGGTFLLNRHMFHLAAGLVDAASSAAATITHHQL